MSVASSGTASVTLPTDEQILITRTFDAPPHLVYRAWTAPELVRRWWSGHRDAPSEVEMDVRVGGRWRYVIPGQGGPGVAFHGEYREVVADRRIVYTEVYETPDAGPEADAAAPVITVTFEPSGSETVLSLLVQTNTKELRDLIMSSGMETGMQGQMDLIEEIASELAPSL